MLFSHDDLRRSFTLSFYAFLENYRNISRLEREMALKKEVMSKRKWIFENGAALLERVNMIFKEKLYEADVVHHFRKYHDIYRYQCLLAYRGGLITIILTISKEFNEV